MLIQNPFGAKNVRCKWKTEKDEQVSVQSDAAFIELPDDCTEALVEGIMSGKSDAEAWTAKMWCKDRGYMEVRDYMQMRQVEEERRKLMEEKQKEVERKQKEARERAVAKEAKKEQKEPVNKVEKEL